MSNQDGHSLTEPNNEIPQLIAEEPNHGATLIRGVTKMVSPSIMQCSQGGFLAVIPGIGLMAASTMEEIMSFVEKHTMNHFEGPKPEGLMPRMMQGAADVLNGATKKVEPMTAATVIGAIAVVALLLFRSAPEPTITSTIVKQPAALLYEVPVRGVRVQPVGIKQ